jgi:hypothetical protein
MVAAEGVAMSAMMAVCLGEALEEARMKVIALSQRN